MKTQLNNRILWFDGTNEVDASLVPRLFMLGVSPKRIVVKASNEHVEKFNMLSDDIIETSKDKNDPFNLTWDIPQEYLTIDVEHYIFTKLKSFLKDKKLDDHATKYIERLEKEILEIEKTGMFDLIRTLIFVIDTFKKNNIVWGVGRGSSCASLALFLIGLHCVDPVKYGIDTKEFFHE